MRVVSRLSRPIGLGLGLLALAPPMALAASQTAVTPNEWYANTVMVPAPSKHYRRLVEQELFDTFGHGGKGRNLYCEGPAVVRFQIAPDGRVTNVRLLKPSLVALNERLLAKISNLQFPAIDGLTAQHPISVTFRYGTWDLAKPSLAARTNCRS